MAFSDVLAAATNMVIPAILGLICAAFWGKEAVFVFLFVYVIGGVVCLLAVSCEGEHPLVVATGWYVGPLTALVGVFYRW